MVLVKKKGSNVDCLGGCSAYNTAHWSLHLHHHQPFWTPIHLHQQHTSPFIFIINTSTFLQLQQCIPVLLSSTKQWSHGTETAWADDGGLDMETSTSDAVLTVQTTEPMEDCVHGCVWSLQTGWPSLWGGGHQSTGSQGTTLAIQESTLHHSTTLAQLNHGSTLTIHNFAWKGTTLAQLSKVMPGLIWHCQPVQSQKVLLNYALA